MSTAITVSHVSKVYRIGASRQSSLRDQLTDSLRSLFAPKALTPFYALRDVSFEVERGAVLAVLGRNGAGKSTLLKVLARITPPTEGRFEIEGRVASLLEVGTGFHGELTGRENVFLNGAIHGMKRAEVRSRFDEIVEFSGIGSFIDTPVKRYSSGMKMRLAFSVAAHLSAEVLFIDEVLAVGDLEFQRKCLGKMRDVASSGRTVLFVSHNIAAARTLCDKGMVITDGCASPVSSIAEALSAYQDQMHAAVESVAVQDGVFRVRDHPNRRYPRDFGMQEVRLFCDDRLSRRFYAGCRFSLELDSRSDFDLTDAMVGFVIKDPEGRPMVGINNRHVGVRLTRSPVRSGTFRCDVERFPLYGNGEYSVDLFWGNGSEGLDILYDACSFSLEPSDVYGSANVLETRLNAVIVDGVRMSWLSLP